MMNYKRLIAALLCLCMVFALCACGQKTPDPTDPTKVTDATDATDATEAKPVAGAELDFAADGSVVLFDSLLQSENADIVSDKGQTFDDFGLVVDGQNVINKYYSLAERTVHYVCKFSKETVAKFNTVTKSEDGSYTVDTQILLSVKERRAITSLGVLNVNILNDKDPFLVSITKNSQLLTLRITNLKNEKFVEQTLLNTGSGGIGSGAVAANSMVGMQCDYYAVGLQDGPAFSISRVAVTSGDYDLLIYGDAISAPEAHWPADNIQNSWVQKLIRNYNGKAMSSGRSGGDIDSILERIQNELPYIKPTYCMVTIGTDGSATQEKLTQLVQYIKEQGATPILNHIPCYDNNGDTTGFTAVNQMIDAVRQAEGITGCDFDLATSLAGDGQEVDTSTMWKDVTGDSVYFRNPNEKGSDQMFQQLQADLPELFGESLLATEGKVCATFGDSITWYDNQPYNTGKENGRPAIGYQKYMRWELGLSQIHNFGYSGAAMPYIVEEVILKQTDEAFWKSLDYMTIMSGANDERLATPLGTIAPKGSEFDTTTYIGGLQSAVEYALSMNPDIQIVLFTPIKGWIYAPKGFGGSNYQSQDGQVTEQWANAVKEVAELYELPVCDLYNECFTYAIKDREAYMNDPEPPQNEYYSLHPNSAGYRVMGEAIVRTFKELG